MTKRVKFVRHSIPDAPFDDYTKLSFNQICALATKTFTPTINANSTIQLLDSKYKKADFIGLELIVTSTSRRTIQTAGALQDFLKKKIPTRKTGLLSEIYFDPSKQMSQEEYEKGGLDLIRQRLFEGIQTGKGAESLDKTIKRIGELEKYLSSLTEQEIVCITHSFLMRFMRLYFFEDVKDGSQISVEKLLKTQDHSYLEGFEINL